LKVLAIDPGSEESGFVVYRPVAPFGVTSSGPVLNPCALLERGVCSNEELLARCWRGRDPADPQHLAIEMIASYGMSVGATVFTTLIWVGRFVEAWGARDYTLVTRHEVKMHLCHTKNSSDANVREALLDRWGGKVVAIGNRRTPGPLYGVASHAWSALAVAVTWSDTRHVDSASRSLIANLQEGVGP